MDESGWREVVTQWHLNFLRGTDFDLWGQPLEATDCYSKYGHFLYINVSFEQVLEVFVIATG